MAVWVTKKATCPWRRPSQPGGLATDPRSESADVSRAAPTPRPRCRSGQAPGLPGQACLTLDPANLLHGPGPVITRLTRAATWLRSRVGRGDWSVSRRLRRVGAKGGAGGWRTTRGPTPASPPSRSGSAPPVQAAGRLRRLRRGQDLHEEARPSRTRRSRTRSRTWRPPARRSSPTASSAGRASPPTRSPTRWRAPAWPDNLGPGGQYFAIFADGHHRQLPRLTGGPFSTRPTPRAR